MNFTIIDWFIIIIYMTFTVYIGLKAKKYIENSEGYFVAGRKVRLSLGVATLVATEIGTVTFMYLAEFGYSTGFAGFFMGILGMIGFLIIGFTGFIVSGLRKLKIMTIPEFYQIKYNKNVRLLGGIILFLSGVLNMGIFLKFDGIFLAETMGFGQEVLFIIMIIMLLIVISYTVLGGMLSVVITDFLQFVILSIGMLFVTILILTKIDISIIGNTVTKVYDNGGINPFENLKLGWVFVAWVFLANIATGCLNQPVASKSFASESPKVARKVFLFYGLTLAGRSMIPMFWGIAALAYFGPDLQATLAMPRLIGIIVPTGLLGLIIAGMLAASMSTYSAYLLSWSSVATRDIISPLMKKELSEEKSMKTAKILSVLIGIFILFFGLVYEIPATAIQYLILTGTMYSAGAFGCIAGGLYWKKSNTVGAYSALVMGAIMPILFLILEKFKSSLPDYLWFFTDINISGFLSILLPLIGMIIGSLLTQKTCPPINITAKLKEAE